MTRLRPPALALVLTAAATLPLGYAVARAAGVPVTLPTGWHIAPATDTVQASGTLPTSVTFTADGQHLVVLDGGAGASQIQVLAAGSLAVERTIATKGAYGVPLADRGGAGVWFSTALEHSLAHLDAATGTIDRTIALPAGFWAASIARAPDGATLAVSDETGNRIATIDERSGTVTLGKPFGSHLAGLAFAPDGTLYVANWGGSSVFALDAKTHDVRRQIPVGRHPEALLLSADARELYVAETDDDTVGVVDLASGSRTRGIDVGVYANTLSGASPAALALDAGRKRLYVACSAANAVVAIATDGERAIGAMPVGWYPTAVAVAADGTLYVANGRGESSRANPQFMPFAGRTKTTGYVAASELGSVRRIAPPDDAALAAGVATVRALGGPYLASAIADEAVRRSGPAAATPGAAVIRAGGPIKHVIYIIKENRTYDQVLGDERAGDGDAALTLFGKRNTPNEHAIAERFGLFDNAYADAEVSADGHNWSTAAFANDYLEKMWPQLYGGRREVYDFEDGATAATPHGGYIWNAAAKAGVSLRNYGEFTTEPDERQTAIGEKGSDVTGPITSKMSDLKEFTDPRFVGFDLNVSDDTRVTEWQREFDGYVKHRNLPSLEIVRLPNDHTAGTRAGERTPAAFLAQNDAAVGRLVSIVSHSAYWRSTMIVSVEDDAQNGPDHVDDHRMPVYLASAYAAGGTQHAHYSTSGILRTIEIVLGLPPLSAYDAAALPLTAAFTDKADGRPYDALPEAVDVNARNIRTAYGAARSARFDLSREDAVASADMNDVIWHAVRGARVPLPAIAHAR